AADAGEYARGCDPLEHACDGQALRAEPDHGQPDLARVCAAASSGRGLHVFQRPAVHREVARHRRALSQPSRAGGGALRRRKGADPGTRPQPARAADASGTGRTAHPRLSALWNYQPVCSAGLQGRTVIGEFHRRHRAIEFRSFLETIDTAVPGKFQLHLILDNYGTHKTPAIKRWLLRHPRFHLHFTPTGASWLNLVERWFAALTDQQLRRGAHRSTRELESAIRDYLDLHNRAPKPFIWTKTADQILESLGRFCKRISNS